MNSQASIEPSERAGVGVAGAAEMAANNGASGRENNEGGNQVPSSPSSILSEKLKIANRKTKSRTEDTSVCLSPTTLDRQTTDGSDAKRFADRSNRRNRKHQPLVQHIDGLNEATGSTTNNGSDNNNDDDENADGDPQHIVPEAFLVEEATRNTNVDMEEQLLNNEALRKEIKDEIMKEIMDKQQPPVVASQVEIINTATNAKENEQDEDENEKNSKRKLWFCGSAACCCILLIIIVVVSVVVVPSLSNGDDIVVNDLELDGAEGSSETPNSSPSQVSSPNSPPVPTQNPAPSPMQNPPVGDGEVAPVPVKRCGVRNDLCRDVCPDLGSYTSSDGMYKCCRGEQSCFQQSIDLSNNKSLCCIGRQACEQSTVSNFDTTDAYPNTITCLSDYACKQMTGVPISTSYDICCIGLETCEGTTT